MHMIIWEHLDQGLLGAQAAGCPSSNPEDFPGRHEGSMGGLCFLFVPNLNSQATNRIEGRQLQNHILPLLKLQGPSWSPLPYL